MGILILNISVIFLYSVVVIIGEIYVETWEYFKWRRVIKTIAVTYLITVLMVLGVLGVGLGLHMAFN